MSLRKRSRLALLLGLSVFCVAAATPPATSAAAEDASIVEAYPDPYADGDEGEYVAVEFHGTDTTGWTLSDGEDETLLPNETLEGTVYFARDGEPASVVATRYIPLGLRLANSGETVRLRDPSGDVVDELRYGDEGGVEPDEGELILASENGTHETRHVAATGFGVLRGNASSLVAFALPDAPKPVVSRLRGANDRVLLSAYTFGSDVLAGALRETTARVEVLAEGSPPGGFPESTEETLGTLGDARRYVADGGQSRYRYFHAKYAVIDNSAVVTSENWEDRNFAPNATGSRGWGVILESPEAADYLAAVFENDTDWRAVSRWENTSVEAHEQDETEAEVRTEYGPLRDDGASYELFVAPDAGVKPVVSLIEEADEEVLVQQAYIRSWNGDIGSNPYVSALRERASEGVDVRVLLDGRWYYEEENRKVAEALNASGIDARISERPVHTKGVVVDNESVLVSSINWNENSPTDNREVGVVVHDNEVASYFASVFEDDWSADDVEDGDDSTDETGGSPADYALEALIIAVVSGIGVWLVAREV